MSMKIPVIKMPEYTLYIEHFDDKIWVHADVSKWTSKVKRQFVEYVNFVLDSYKQDTYVVNESEGYYKRKKFMEYVGFKFLCINNFGNQQFRDVYRREYHG